MTKNLAKIARCLLDAGLADATPIAIIHAATLADESTTVATLSEAASGSVRASSPSILIIGDVVNKQIKWKE